jgi:DNA-binding MarR family transcriptional regulator
MSVLEKQGESIRHFDSLEQKAYLSLWRTYDRLWAVENELFSQWELTAQQYNILRLLLASFPRPVPTLSLVSRLISRAPDVTRMLDRLETRGLISRERSSEDRRTIFIAITEKGKRLLKAIARPLQQCHRQQLGHLSEAQLRTLVELLDMARHPHELPDSPWRQ